ncbi:hypothetical protein [Hymenobacter oligotrophus]|nr:hypothetical protein [Hymenobacter oligotrophus]
MNYPYALLLALGAAAPALAQQLPPEPVAPAPPRASWHLGAGSAGMGTGD